MPTSGIAHPLSPFSIADKYFVTIGVFMKLMNSLFLFKLLIKSGCRWEGDVSHRLWSERLYFNEGDKDKIVEVLKDYKEDRDFKFEDNSIWIT